MQIDDIDVDSNADGPIFSTDDGDVKKTWHNFEQLEKQ
jgi:hypothetical protein